MKPRPRFGLNGLRRPISISNGINDRRLASSASSVNHVSKPISSVLIANRGEIALRVNRTASLNGVRTTTIYTDPDAESQHVRSSPRTVNLGASTEYLNGDAIIKAALRNNCDSIHPGYGFLSENAAFARKCTEAGLNFIGPPWQAIEAMGNKSRSKEIMTAAGVPCTPGYHGSNQEPQYLLQEAEKVGFPVLLKAVKGGGGKGMRISNSSEDFYDQLKSAKSEAQNSFGDDTMLVEKYIQEPRHIEVQIFADKHGNCVALGERDCSLQRRHQKIIEESPAPNLEDAVREDMWEKARAAALAVQYVGAGTVEFIFDNQTQQFYFMEMNTRLQVEHPVSEMITGQDLVQWQLDIAEGGKLPLSQDQIKENISELGWAIEARIYAENPAMNFMPDAGKIVHLRLPETSSDVRVDAGFVEGDEISSHYDPMIAKLIVRGSDRRSTIQKLYSALEQYEVVGPATNIDFLKSICDSRDFISGLVETGYIEKHHNELFAKKIIPSEVLAQTALGLVLQDVQQKSSPPGLSSSRLALGFGSSFQPRTFLLAGTENNNEADNPPFSVTISQISPDKFKVSLNKDEFSIVTARLEGLLTVASQFPHTQLRSTVIRTAQKVSIFQQGIQYSFQLVTPDWAQKVLGSVSAANSVVAPMPCKVIRVDVEEGQEVKKNQVLVVIESMKMESTIRSPQDGIISKIVHSEGDICKAGTALVEFQASDS